MRQRKPLSNSRIACIILLWVMLVVYIFMYAKIDGMVIVSIIMSGAFVFIPIFKSIKKRKK